MAATLACSSALRTTPFAATVRQRQQQRCSAARRVPLRVAAMADDGKDDARLSFESNKRAALGFTESDSAGQTNIFAVEPRSYVAGSNEDSSSGAGVTLAIGAVGALIAAAAISGGLLANSNGTGLDAVAPSGEYKTLTAYADEFAAEFGSPAAAPAVAE